MRVVTALLVCLAVAMPTGAAFAGELQAAEVGGTSVDAPLQADKTAKGATKKMTKKEKRLLKLNKARSKFIKRVNRTFEMRKDLFNAKLKNDLKMIRDAAKTASMKRLKRLESMRAFTVYRAKMNQKVSGADSWGRTKLDYVKEWGARNDKFLAGSPMAGTGYVIASAAYDNDMDPRLYSAIAAVESGKGRAPYGNRYNVCGWVCGNPPMYSWADAANKWHSFFRPYFKGERYPISSLHGYGPCGPQYVNEQMARI